MLVEQVPVAVISWAIGSATVFLFGLKNWQRYQASNNYLSKYFGLFGLAIGVSLGLSSFPAFFSDKIEVLRPLFLIGDLLLFVALFVQARILWFIGLKEKLSFVWLAVPTALASAVAWLAGVAGTQMELAAGILIYRYPPLSLWIQVALLATIILPAGAFFVKAGLSEGFGGARLKAGVKSTVIGLAYLLVGSMTILTYIQNQGTDTFESSLFNGAIFLLLLFVLLLPPLRSRAGN